MIKVGPAGSSGLGNLKGVNRVAEMGLDCMEVEFTYGVRMDPKSAKAVGALARPFMPGFIKQGPPGKPMSGSKKHWWDCKSRLPAASGR
jgi:endonuclease IV